MKQLITITIILCSLFAQAQLPEVSAGRDTTVTEGQFVYLKGTSNTGWSLAHWFQWSGPSTVKFVEEYKASTAVSGMIPGEYKFGFVVFTSKGVNWDSCTVRITRKY